MPVIGAVTGGVLPASFNAAQAWKQPPFGSPSLALFRLLDCGFVAITGAAF